MAEVRAARMGLSPRMRGNIGALVPCDETDRPIPVHTGEPTVSYTHLTLPTKA